MAGDGGAPGIPSWSRTYVEAWNSHDPARLVECMTDDVVFEDKAVGERVVGKDAVRSMLRDMLQSFSSDFRIEHGELLLVADDLWAAEWTMTGTNDREDTVHGLPNTGRPFRVQGLSIGRLRDGKVAEERLYWNMADYLGQIGLMPASAGASA